MINKYSETYLGALCFKYETTTDKKQKEKIGDKILIESKKILELNNFPNKGGEPVKLFSYRMNGNVK